ncbi:MAG: hypothetical protein H7A55_22015 [Verrucomicrobiaceae bacterium]|nr:hypothetical protein [Verrucomicrobiaceae bacterium]
MNDSIADLKEQLRNRPDDWDLRLRLADAHRAAGEAAHATILLTTAPAPPQEAGHLIHAGNHLLDLATDRALEYANDVMRHDEMNAAASLLAANAWKKKGDPAQAEKFYLTAVTLDPSLENESQALRDWIQANADQSPRPGTAPVVLQSLQAVADEDDEPVAVAVVDDDDAPTAWAAMPPPDAAAVALTDEPVSDELLDARPKERRMFGAKFTAATTALLIHAGLIALLGLIAVAVPTTPTAEITAMTAAEQVQEKPETKKIIVPQPTTSTAAVARPTTSAMTAVGVSAVSLPEFDFKAPAEPVAEVATTDLGNSFSAAFQPKGTVQVNFFGIKSKGRRIAFLIEAERYMLTDPKGGIPAYEIVKDEIANMIAKFGVNTAFNVLLFDHFSLSAFREKLVPATTSNINEVRDWFYPVNREFEKIGLAAINYPKVQPKTEIEPIRNKMLQGYMLAIQYALESDVDTVFIITSGWRHMGKFENREEYEKYLKDVKWGPKEEAAWVAAVAEANAWLKKENQDRLAKGVPQRVIRSIHEIVGELGIRVRHKPSPNIEAEEREKQVINAMRAIYSSKDKPKPQINFVLFVGKDEKIIPMESHFEEIAQRARGGKLRVLQGMAALKNVSGRK